MGSIGEALSSGGGREAGPRGPGDQCPHGSRFQDWELAGAK